MNTREALLVHADILAENGLLVIFAGAVGFGLGSSINATFDAGSIVSRSARAGQRDTSESHLARGKRM